MTRSPGERSSVNCAAAGRAAKGERKQEGNEQPAPETHQCGDLKAKSVEAPPKKGCLHALVSCAGTRARCGPFAGKLPGCEAPRRSCCRAGRSGTLRWPTPPPRRFCAAARGTHSLRRASANALFDSSARRFASSNFLPQLRVVQRTDQRLIVRSLAGKLRIGERLADVRRRSALCAARRPAAALAGSRPVSMVAQRLVFHDRVEELGLQHVLRAGVAELDILGRDLRRLRALGGADGRFRAFGRPAGCCCR